MELMYNVAPEVIFTYVYGEEKYHENYIRDKLLAMKDLTYWWRTLDRASQTRLVQAAIMRADIMKKV